MSLSVAEAQARIERMVDYNTDPVLSASDMSDLLEVAARPDTDGNLYSDGTLIWTPTWDLNSAAAEGWRRKAGRAAGRFNFGEDGQRFERAQTYAHCLSQADHYGRKIMGAIPVGGTASTS